MNISRSLKSKFRDELIEVYFEFAKMEWKSRKAHDYAVNKT